jgi:hypothetical protein
MASKFVTLAEAAAQLGVTPEALNELRQRGDLYGYRDGTSWKFKPEDVSRVAEQLASGAGRELAEELSGEILGDSHEISDVPMDLPIDPDDIEDSADDVVLLSEFELGESGPSASATVIGQPGLPLSSIDSDVKLVTASEEAADASSTTIGSPGAPQRPGESVIKLAAPRADEPGASRTMIGVPGQPLSPDDSAIKLRSGGGQLDSPSSTVIGKPGQPLTAGEGDIKLSTFEDSDFDVGSLKPTTGGVIDAGLSPSGASTVLSGEPPVRDIVVDSGITLADEHSDDDFVLGGPGSDITISPGDSGISLVDPADSGLSLDAPIELAAAGEASFDVAESGEDLGSPTEFDSDEVMELKTGEEFLLTPMAPEGEESSEDSGSQVIAIDSESSPFEATDSSMFASAEGSMSTMLEEDVGGAGPALAEGALGGAAPAFAAAAGPVPIMVGETPYPVWVVLLMGFCVLFLALCGMMMYDLVRNMWSWNAPYPVNSTIMDAIMGLFG